MNERSEEAAPIEHVVVCGSGLAAHMTVCALSRRLPPSIRITFANIGDNSGTDLFYGSASAPTAYSFNLSAGVSEPKLVLESDAAFSWGTEYVEWPGGNRSWIQCFHLALPVIDGVLFHHYLARLGDAQLERYLAPAVAARRSAFVHPPQRPGQTGQHPLARAEYGYQFDPASYSRLFQSSTDNTRVRQVDGALAEVEVDESGIASIRLLDGRSLEADLYIDASGPAAWLLSSLQPAFPVGRRLRAAMSRTPVAQLGAPLRQVLPASYGWRAETPLQGSTALTTVYDPESEAEALSAHGSSPERSAEAAIGRRANAWSRNCVAVGHAARIVEPLTPAPLMLLERDIERLLSLVPFSSEMSVERREFNRRFVEDHEHADIFTRALFETDGLPDTPYWRAAWADPVGEKLARKIELFEDRGVLVAYDLEPFHPEDWTILHYGMGRLAARYDRTADRAQSAQVQNLLSNLKREIDKAVEGLPSHAAYMTELKQYLLRNNR